MKKMVVISILLLCTTKAIYPSLSLQESIQHTAVLTKSYISRTLQAIHDITIKPVINTLHELYAIGTEKYMLEKYKAQPCKDKQLVEEFQVLQNKLNLSYKVPLFTTEAKPEILPCKDTVAFYDFKAEAIAIIPQKFYCLSNIHKSHVLYHELKHHLQNKALWHKYAPHIESMIKDGTLTEAQAMEHDADLFGIECATAHCPTCLKLLKCYFYKNKPKAYYGYFTQADFEPMINKAKKEKCYCSKHQSKLNRIATNIQSTAISTLMVLG